MASFLTLPLPFAHLQSDCLAEGPAHSDLPPRIRRFPRHSDSVDSDAFRASTSSSQRLLQYCQDRSCHKVAARGALPRRSAHSRLSRRDARVSLIENRTSLFLDPPKPSPRAHDVRSLRARTYHVRRSRHVPPAPSRHADDASPSDSSTRLVEGLAVRREELPTGFRACFGGADLVYSKHGLRPRGAGEHTLLRDRNLSGGRGMECGQEGGVERGRGVFGRRR
ncbi:uncharacterized protein BXZ73DRAFT_78321 [Epithele typhae]|uniref:uncharacterized protein n=1 Tax=Epithele typhae TaxID=378194 RepID=UPI002007D503|nr:uncharacterized protein BXZ73DRAFT_78321 [Epithele typhae]KAH9928508.1 hypothetical protein BXZ73DRAFT_78321 [Epithele typhae]